MSAAPFDPLTPGALELLALLAMRIGGFLLVAPVFSRRTIPMRHKAALLVVLTVALLPAAVGGAGGAPPRITAATLLSETVVGFAIGMGAAVFIGAAELAGDVLAVQTGLSSASALDPVTQAPVPTLGRFLGLFALTVFLAVGGHLLALRALAASAEVVPVGGGLDLAAGLGALVSLGGTLFAVGLRFAAPVIAATFVATLALGILAKAAAQFNVLIVAFPVQIGVGLFALAAAVPMIAAFFGSWPTTYEAVVSDLLSALRP